MSPKIILGIFIILFGLSIIINHVFKINIPLGKFLFGLFIIYLGVKILLGGFGVNINVNGDKNAVFSKHDYAPKKLKTSNEYNAVFGSSVIDLSDTEIAENETVKLELNSVFGNLEIKIPKDVKVKIESNGVLGSVVDKRSTNIEIISTKTLYIEANAVFGAIVIK